MTIKTHLRETLEVALQAYSKKTSSTLRESSRGVLSNPSSPALAILIAARHVYGHEVFDFEPETLWLEFQPPLVNRDKLMAAIALHTYPSFYWDYRVFGHTALAFGDHAVFGDAVPRCDVSDLAWAVVEAESIFALTDESLFKPHFDEAIEVYTAATLFDAGFVLAPEVLSFADDTLRGHITDQSLREEVTSAWGQLDKNSLESSKYEDSAKGVQLARLAEVDVYLVNRLKAVTKVLRKL